MGLSRQGKYFIGEEYAIHLDCPNHIRTVGSPSKFQQRVQLGMLKIPDYKLGVGAAKGSHSANAQSLSPAMAMADMNRPKWGIDPLNTPLYTSKPVIGLGIDMSKTDLNIKNQKLKTNNEFTNHG